MVVAVFVALLSVVTASRRVEEGRVEKRTDAPFYALPVTLPAGTPGAVIRRENIASAPFATVATRVIYHSRDQAGRDIAVSGIVIAPTGPPPPRGRTIVSWAHPTTGATAHCAPSLGLDPFLLVEGMHELLAAGYVIAATDYPGLGVAGDSSYLLGIPESNSVLDAARAARTITGASDRVVLWGHSQGGQAALFAAQRARAYAPELELQGVAVAAPAADLNQLMTDDIGDLSGVTIASYAFASYGAAYADRYSKAEITAILTPAGAAATPQMTALCLLQQNADIHAIAAPLVSDYVTGNPATTEPWKTLLAENSAGSQPIDVPVFVGQGLADTLVRPTATADYVRTLCAAGTDVVSRTYRGIDHGTAAYASVPDLMLWLADVTTGRRPASSC
jgi:alpha-beta hydrolase superfamily lysophospholipase